MIGRAQQLRTHLMEAEWNDSVYNETAQACNEHFQVLNEMLSAIDGAVSALNTLIDELDAYFRTAPTS